MSKSHKEMSDEQKKPCTAQDLFLTGEGIQCGNCGWYDTMENIFPVNIYELGKEEGKQ